MVLSVNIRWIAETLVVVFDESFDVFDIVFLFLVENIVIGNTNDGNASCVFLKNI